MLRGIICSLTLLFVFSNSNSQSVGIGHLDNTTIDASAILDIQSTTQGALLPRMTMIEKDAISNPEEGLTIYQTDEGGGYYIFQNGKWKCLGPTDTESDFRIGSADGSSTQQNIFDGSIYSDQGTLYDIGGPSGNYPLSTEDEITIYSIATALDVYGAIIYVEELNLSDVYDTLIIQGRPFLLSEKDTFYTNDYFLDVKFVSNSSGSAAGFKVSWKFIHRKDIEPTSQDDFTRSWKYDRSNGSMSGGVNTSNGFDSDSLGNFSIQYGEDNKSKGDFSVTMGKRNYSGGYASTSFGGFNTVSDDYSFAAGYNNKVSSQYAFASGYDNKISGYYSAAFGELNQSIGAWNLVGGAFNYSNGNYNLIGGYINKASGWYNIVEGDYNEVRGSENLVVGSSNYVTTSRALVAGTYCDSIVSVANGFSDDAPLLQIGIGSSPATIQNGLWFTKSGKLYFGADLDDEILIHNSDIYERFNTDLDFGSGNDHGYIASHEASGEGGGIYFDGNATTIWNPGDAQGGSGLSNTYLIIVDEDNFDNIDTNPYNNNAIKAYLNSSGLWQQSDEDRKENIKPTEYGLEEVLNLSGYEYSFKKNEEEIAKGDVATPTIGLLAQEVKEHLPLVVEESEHGDHFVNYSLIVPVLIESIKELKAEIEELKLKNK